jgi:hypothetical protein
MGPPRPRQQQVGRTTAAGRAAARSTPTAAGGRWLAHPQHDRTVCQAWCKHTGGPAAARPAVAHVCSAAVAARCGRWGWQQRRSRRAAATGAAAAATPRRTPAGRWRPAAEAEPHHTGTTSVAPASGWQAAAALCRACRSLQRSTAPCTNTRRASLRRACAMQEPRQVLRGVISLLEKVGTECAAPRSPLPPARDATDVVDSLHSALGALLAAGQEVPQAVQENTGVPFLCRWLLAVHAQLSPAQQLQALECLAALATAGCGEWRGSGSAGGCRLCSVRGPRSARHAQVLRGVLCGHALTAPVARPLLQATPASSCRPRWCQRCPSLASLPMRVRLRQLRRRRSAWRPAQGPAQRLRRCCRRPPSSGCSRRTQTRGAAC